LRGSPFFAFLACVAVCAGVVAAQANDQLRVRPLIRREGLVRPAQPRLPAHVNPEWLSIQAERDRRWREFPDDLTGRVGRSARASGRAGWRPPASRRWPTPDRRGGVLGPADAAELIRVAFIRIDFLNDRGGGRSTGNGRFDLSGPDTTQPPVDRPPHNRSFYLAHLEALKRYYDAQSYGGAVIEGDVWPRDQGGAYSVSDMADFGPWKLSQDIVPALVHMFRTMMFAADSQSIVRGDRIPWNDYDRIVVIHAGSDFQSDLRQDSPLDIPSLTFWLADSEAVVFPPDSINRDRPIDAFLLVPETQSQDGYYSALNGVLAHECGHLFFGFQDIYDVHTFYPVVGYWSLMDSGNNVGSIVILPDDTELFATGLLPPSLDPWNRFRILLLDQLPFPEVAYGDTMALTNIERNPDLRRVTLSSDEYLLLENRYLAPADSVRLDQDEVTRVVLGPKTPDRFEYDALLPGGGVLVWHIDESVIPNEYTFPCDTARANPDCGVNSDPVRRGVSIIEADGLEDLGDLGSPYLLGAPFDPFFLSNYPTLSDTTAPNLIPHVLTRPHIRLGFLDDPDSTMHVSAMRTWQLPGWPIAADFPPGGPILLPVDADGDRKLEVCWAGGDTAGMGVTALYAVRTDGQGLFGPSHLVLALDRRPLPVMAALTVGESPRVPRPDAWGGGSLPSVSADTVFAYFAATTYADGADTSLAGGRVWLVQVERDSAGAVPGWPPRLPSIVTTPPVIGGLYPNATVYVGCADGRVYALGLDGSVLAASDPPLPGGIRGRLAVIPDLAARPPGSGPFPLVAAGGAEGDVAVFGGGAGLAARSGWPQRVGSAGFEPDFLWIDFGGALNSAQDCFRGALSLVVHHADRLWAYCLGGEPLPGWGRQFSDALVSALGAGDPDGDGFPEVLAQTINSKLSFINLSGYPSPGWPKRGSPEDFRTGSPPMSLDLDGDGRGDVVAMNGSGIIAALRLDGKAPEGWPLASGLGATGAPVAADLDRDGTLEVVAPDRQQVLYGYSIPTRVVDHPVTTWTMLGGDAGRTSAVILDPTAVAPAPAPGPLVQGSLKAFPNPARRRPVSFAYQLTEQAEVEFRILDTSGHEVASFTRRGRQADNLEVWEPGGLPAGIYLARLRFRGAGSERTELVPVGLLR
jgi:M6 family metalloprotease-like protein